MIARRFLLAALAAGVLTLPAFVPNVSAKATAQKARPSDATAQCEDGSYSRAKTQQGACSSHGGVKTWYGEPPVSVPAASSTASSKAVTTSKPKTATAPPSSTAATPSGATAQCKDGSYSHAKTQQGACSSHGGVATWFGESTTSTPATSNSRAATPARRSGTPVSGAPNGATAQCQDGSYSTAQSRQGACSGHGGVATWLDETATKETPTPPPTQAKPPAEAPTRVTKADQGNATAKCKDGTLSYSKHHSGTCSHHGGVAEWYK
jgi:Protein of unknown function (DUF3761)